jgi:hypothetical protein
MANGRVDPDDDDALPLDEEELQAIALRVTVALSSPPGSGAPDPRPRKDTLEEAYDSVLRLLREVRRLRRRDERSRDALRAALSAGEPDAMRSAIEDVLDDTV